VRYGVKNGLHHSKSVTLPPHILSPLLIIDFYRLTVGSAIGSIRDLFVKIKAIDDKHGKFDLVLCTGDFFGPPKAPDVAVNEEDELLQLLRGELEGSSGYLVLFVVTHFSPAPIECYIMQGEYPLPEPVIEKFAKTGGQLCKSVFLLSEPEEYVVCLVDLCVFRQVWHHYDCPRTSNSVFGWHI
jgi:hypothetical protein